MVKLISQLLLAVGVMVAVTAAAKLPANGQNFSDMWPYTLIGIGISFVGVVLWHRANRQPTELQTESAIPIDDPLQRIRQMAEPLDQLAATAGQLPTKDLQAGIDKLLDQFVLPVTEARRQILATLGIQAAAELLIDFSAVERKLNRAWSAAGDGNLAEAVGSIQEAKTSYAAIEKPE